MNKALKALYEISEGMRNNVGFIKEFKLIQQALTPPTEEEVCKALSEWFDDTFYYDTNQREFYTKALNGQHSVAKLKNNELHFGGWHIMPPRLITLIGRLYEGLNNE